MFQKIYSEKQNTLLIFRWYIPVVHNYNYTNNIRYTTQKQQIYYGVPCLT